MTAKKVVSTVLLVFLASGALLAQFRDIPLTNWEVPPYRVSSPSGGFGTMADVTPAVSFVGVTPCRLVDTRPAAAFPAGYGVPALTAGAPRNFDLNSAAHCTGIPAGVEAYSLNITVTETQGPGFILIFPQGGAAPNVSTLNYLANQTIANAAIVPAGTNGGVTVIAGVSGTHLIIDINGYFTDDLNTGVQFVQVGSVAGAATALFINNNEAAGSHAVGGFQGGRGANSYGLEGQINTSAGTGSAGVHGIANIGTEINYGGEFESTNTTAQSAGVIGDGDNTTGETYGVLGDNDSTTNCSAGVWGRSGANLPCDLLGGNVGVVATNTGVRGMVGISSNASGRGVQGMRITGSPATLATLGILGYTGTSGVHSFDDITKAGSVAFIEPHPTDATKLVKFVSLEGNEVGTYFRGRSKFQRGVATIDVPEEFRLVSDADGLSIQVTPIGEMATYAVASIDLNRIVVKGSRNVEFFYTVNGVRRNHADFKAIAENVHFVPLNAEDTMAEWPEAHRRLLIQNGTLKPDGTVNMETAQRLGWDLQWKKEIERQVSEQAADREADRQGVPEGTTRPEAQPE
jgi:hypothetical protein